MTAHSIYGLLKASVIVGVLLLGLFPLGLPLKAQQASLQIVSPTEGTTFSPGQTISVSVTSPAGLSFASVTVVGEQPLWASAAATSVPAQCSIAIPQTISPGTYLLTAMGKTTAGAVVQSDPVGIVIERLDAPTSLKAQPPRLLLQVAGQQSALNIAGTFPDGSIRDVTSSSHTSFASSNSAIATVDTNGTVTAVAAGKTYVTVTYVLGSQSPKTVIPVIVQSPVLNSSPSTLNFGSVTVGSSSSPQTLTISNASNNQGLKIGAVTPSGDFSESDNCVSTTPLAVGATCAIQVTFAPTLTGSRSGAIKVTDSMTSVPFQIPLAGTGTAASPHIASLNPTSGPVGTSVTISGTNFGVSQGMSTITFNGTTATPTSWSATSIVAPVPSGATTGNVIVTVGGVASNGVSFTVSAANPPNITGISPQSGPWGAQVTLTGSGFGATQGSSSVTFNGTVGTIDSWSDASILVENPLVHQPHCGTFNCNTATVVVTVNGVASNGVTFIVVAN